MRVRPARQARRFSNISSTLGLAAARRLERRSTMFNSPPPFSTSFSGTNPTNRRNFSKACVSRYFVPRSARFSGPGTLAMRK
eukprot:5944542-Lingulodinium_polyedra.AAC.1